MTNKERAKDKLVNLRSNVTVTVELGIGITVTRSNKSPNKVTKSDKYCIAILN